MSRIVSSLSRRDALKLAGGAMLAPTVLSSSVFAATPPSDLLAMGCIGTGRKGRGDMLQCLTQGLKEGARVVAVCDVDANRATAGKKMVDEFYQEHLGKSLDCQQFADYRELLERADIDGVVISTPDHWHALNAIHAAGAGKDIYLQKPLTYTVEEGQMLVEAVRKNDRVLQTGSQQRSSDSFQRACKLAREGTLGKLQTIEVLLPPDSGTGDPTAMPVPKNLDYDFWMGPTAKAKYTMDRVHPQNGFSRPGWLQIEGYCRGMITGWGVHMNDIAQWGNGSDLSGPSEFEAKGEFPDRGLFDVHTNFTATLKYPNGVVLQMATGPAGVKFIGSDGWVHVTRGSIEASDPAWVANLSDVKLDRSDLHMQNFLSCMRSRKEPAAPVEVGHRSNSLCVCTHIAMKLGRKLHWNPEAEQFVGDDEANAMLRFSPRAPWNV